MENKYYTPKVEDLLIGYECEIKAPKFKGRTFIVDEDQMQYAAFCIRGGFLFTPCLTTEQIEAEGWQKKEIHFFVEATSNSRIFLSPIFSSEEGNWISIYRAIDGDTTPYTMFAGKCPSINELRFIMKLLGINATKNTTKEVH